MMRKIKSSTKIDWMSKLVDLAIVIIGLTIAFKLNTWNDSVKNDVAVKEYIESFYTENKTNHDSLVSALDYSKSCKKDIDTLKQILQSKNYSDKRIKPLVASMMGLANYTASTTTMQNISASGDFSLLKDIDLRKSLISTYDAYKTTAKLELLITDYVNQYVTPFFFKSFRISNFSDLNKDFAKDPLFENTVFGYDVLLTQLINGYQENLERINQLDVKLTAARALYE